MSRLFLLLLLPACAYAVDDAPSSNGMPRAFSTMEAQAAAQSPELLDTRGEMQLPASCEGLLGASAALEEDEEDGDSARDLFLQASQAYEIADYAGALVAFCETYRLARRPALLFNIAVTLERVGMDAQAADFFDEAVSGGIDASVSRRADRARRRAAAD